MDVLLSIKPKFVTEIRENRKKFEFRKSIFNRNDVDRVFIYETSPVKKVVGYFTIDGIIEEHPERLWEISKNEAGIDEPSFFKYFDGRSLGFAIKIADPVFFEEPMELDCLIPGSNAPQSFVYLDGQSKGALSTNF